MHRRISLAIEFKKSDHIMREKIWKAAMPASLPVDEDINFAYLAKKYELVGGTVKNAWLQAIYLQVTRGGDKVSQEDLEKAASEQVQNQLTTDDFDRRVIPSCGVDSMVLEDSVKESLSHIVQYTARHRVCSSANGDLIRPPLICRHIRLVSRRTWYWKVRVCVVLLCLLVCSI